MALSAMLGLRTAARQTARGSGTAKVSAARHAKVLRTARSGARKRKSDIAPHSSARGRLRFVSPMRIGPPIVHFEDRIAQGLNFCV